MQQQPPAPVQSRDAEPVYGAVGCEEDRVVQVSYRLRSSEEYVDAAVVVVSSSNLKQRQEIPPVFDARTRIVTGGVRIRGLDRGLTNCPGGGNVTVGMRVRVRGELPAAAF